MEAVLEFRSTRCSRRSAFFTGAPVATLDTWPSIPQRSSGLVGFGRVAGAACGALGWGCCANSAGAAKRIERWIFGSSGLFGIKIARGAGLRVPRCELRSRRPINNRPAGYQPAPQQIQRREGPVAKPAPQRTRRRFGRGRAVQEDVPLAL